MRPAIDSQAAAAAVRTWRRLEAVLPYRLITSLRPPPLPEEITAVERVLGESLPESFMSAVRVHDGQRREAPPLLEGWRLLRLADVLRYWHIARERARLRTLGVVIDPRPEPARGVSAAWYHARWLPVMLHEAGPIACLDLAPDLGGKRGQIVVYSDHDPARFVLASSFTGWLSRHADRLQRAVPDPSIYLP